MPGICSCITAPITVPINCRYGCSSITRAIIDLRPETTASAPHFGTMYSGRCCADDLGPTDWSSRQPAGSRRRVFRGHSVFSTRSSECLAIHSAACFSVAKPLTTSVSPSGQRTSTTQPSPGFFRATKTGRCSDIRQICACGAPDQASLAALSVAAMRPGESREFVILAWAVESGSRRSKANGRRP